VRHASHLTRRTPHCSSQCISGMLPSCRSTANMWHTPALCGRHRSGEPECQASGASPLSARVTCGICWRATIQGTGGRGGTPGISRCRAADWRHPQAVPEQTDGGRGHLRLLSIRPAKGTPIVGVVVRILHLYRKFIMTIILSSFRQIPLPCLPTGGARYWTSIHGGNRMALSYTSIHRCINALRASQHGRNSRKQAWASV
jgi:hypothetical protein